MTQDIVEAEILLRLERAVEGDGEALATALTTLVWRRPRSDPQFRRACTAVLEALTDELERFADGTLVQLRGSGWIDRYAVCIRRSALQLAIDEYGVALALPAVLDDPPPGEGFAAADIPPGLPDSHWWWLAHTGAGAVSAQTRIDVLIESTAALRRGPPRPAAWQLVLEGRSVLARVVDAGHRGIDLSVLDAALHATGPRFDPVDHPLRRARQGDGGWWWSITDVDGVDPDEAIAWTLASLEAAVGGDPDRFDDGLRGMLTVGALDRLGRLSPGQRGGYVAQWSDLLYGLQDELDACTTELEADAVPDRWIARRRRAALRLVAAEHRGGLVSPRRLRAFGERSER